MITRNGVRRPPSEAKWNAFHLSSFKKKDLHLNENSTEFIVSMFSRKVKNPIDQFGRFCYDRERIVENDDSQACKERTCRAKKCYLFDQATCQLRLLHFGWFP